MPARLRGHASFRRRGRSDSLRPVFREVAMESAEGLDARIVAAIIAGVISGFAALALALFNRGAQRDM